MSAPADPRIEEIRRLIGSPEAPRRLFGFLRLEERLPDLPSEGLDKLVGAAEHDRDPQILQVGRRLSAALVERQKEERFPKGGRSIFEIGTAPGPKEVGLLGKDVSGRLAGAAEALAGTCLDQLEARLDGRSVRLANAALLAVADLGHPRFLPCLERLAGHEELTVSVVEAAQRASADRAREVLRSLAGSTTPGRVLALRALAVARDPEAQGLVEQAVREPSSDVRAAAAGALGYLPGPESSALLRRLLDDSTVEVQLAAIDGLARHRDPLALPRFLELLRLRADDPRLRASLVATLRDLRSPDAEEQLVRLLRDPDGRVRANAVEALAGYEMTAQKAIRTFRPLTADGPARQRGNAVLALYLSHPPSATEALMELFDSFEVPVRQAAVYCAGMMQSKRATERLALLMRTEQDTDVLRTGIRALSKIRGREAIEILRKFAERSYGDVCVAAVNLLAELGDPAAVSTLARLARDTPDPPLRAAAVQGISRLAGHQGLQYLPRFLRDGSERVVLAAIDGLAQTGNLEAIPLLTPLLSAREARVRASAAVALWQLGEFGCFAGLARLLAATAEDEVAAGLQALGRIGASLRVSPLAERPVLRMALLEAYRRAFPDQPVVPGDVPAPPGRTGPPVPDILSVSSAGPDSSEDLAAILAAAGGGGGPARVDPGAPPPAPAPASGSEAARPAPGVPAGDGPSRAAVPPDREPAEVAIELLLQGLGGEPPGPSAARDAARLHPDSPELLHLALREALGEADQSTYAELVKEGLERAPGFLAPLYLLARESGQRGELATALAAYFAIARTQLEELTRLTESGEDSLRRGELDTATGLARLLPTMLPYLPRFHALLGDHYLGRRDYPRATRHLLRALVSFPEDSLVALKLASAALREGRKGLARVAARLAARGGGDGPVATRARALIERLETEDP